MAAQITCLSGGELEQLRTTLRNEQLREERRVQLLAEPSTSTSSKIKLTPPKVLSVPADVPTGYLEGIKNLWETGRDQRLFVTMSLDDFKIGYLNRVYQLALKDCGGKILEIPSEPIDKEVDLGSTTCQQLVSCLGPNFDARTFPIEKMEKRYFGLTDLHKDKYHSPSLRSAVTIMIDLLDDHSDNPKGTYENHDYLGFKMLDRGSLPPIPIVEFSDGGDWDYPLFGFHYPKYLPNGDWEIGQYVPLTKNWMLKPNGHTFGYEDKKGGYEEYKEYCDHDDFKWQTTCDEYKLVFKCASSYTDPMPPEKHVRISEWNMYLMARMPIISDDWHIDWNQQVNVVASEWKKLKEKLSKETF